MTYCPYRKIVLGRIYKVGVDLIMVGDTGRIKKVSNPTEIASTMVCDK